MSFRPAPPRAGEGWMKKTQRMILPRPQSVSGPQVPVDTGDFRLLSRRAVEAVKQLREHHRFMRVCLPGSGFAR